MFERYTEQARRALFFARYEASQLGSVVIDTEHLLLGLIREDNGLCDPIFARFGISREEIRRELEGRSAFREKVATSVEIPFSEPAKHVLQFAAEEADRLLHNYIGPEHLLLGILREERSVAAAVLIEAGMSVGATRAEIVRLLNEDVARGKDVAQSPLQQSASSGPAPTLRFVREGFRQPAEELSVGWTLRLRGHEYWFEREGQAPEGPYCVTCWETNRRWVRKGAGAPGQVVCPNCGEGGSDS